MRTKLESANEAKNRAEAEAQRLNEQIKAHTGTAEELDKLKKELETAQKSGEEQGNKLLELTREKIASAYKIPRETVDSKDLKELSTFEEALKAVTGGNLGNLAFGATGGGADQFKDMTPRQIAAEGYKSYDKK
jgi:hypothetical protein